MGFGSGFSSTRKAGLKVISGSHGQVLRFHSGSQSVIGEDNLKMDNNVGLSITGSIQLKGDMDHSGSIAPTSDGVHTLGVAGRTYSVLNIQDIAAANVYSGDIHMKNERGDWTIYEERTSLVVQNNITGERFKLMMEKIEE